jgi:hypothetical protein
MVDWELVGKRYLDAWQRHRECRAMRRRAGWGLWIYEPLQADMGGAS